MTDAPTPFLGTPLVPLKTMGVPEGFHGSRRMFFMFNVGVFGGACCVLVWDVHRPVVGMSAGMYALLGMHAADLILNWGQKKYRKAMMLLLFSVCSQSFDLT